MDKNPHLEQSSGQPRNCCFPCWVYSGCNQMGTTWLQLSSIHSTWYISCKPASLPAHYSHLYYCKNHLTTYHYRNCSTHQGYTLTFHRQNVAPLSAESSPCSPSGPTAVVFPAETSAPTEPCWQGGESSTVCWHHEVTAQQLLKTSAEAKIRLSHPTDKILRILSIGNGTAQ